MLTKSLLWMWREGTNRIRPSTHYAMAMTVFLAAVAVRPPSHLSLAPSAERPSISRRFCWLHSVFGSSKQPSLPTTDARLICKTYLLEVEARHKYASWAALFQIAFSKLDTNSCLSLGFDIGVGVWYYQERKGKEAQDCCSPCITHLLWNIVSAWDYSWAQNYMILRMPAYEILVCSVQFQNTHWFIWNSG